MRRLGYRPRWYERKSRWEQAEQRAWSMEQRRMWDTELSPWNFGPRDTRSWKDELMDGAPHAGSKVFNHQEGPGSPGPQSQRMMRVEGPIFRALEGALDWRGETP